MKTNKKTTLIILTVLVVLLLSAGFVVLFQMNQNKQVTEEIVEEGPETFAEHTTVEVFANVPAMLTKESKIGTAYEYGDKHYTIDINGTSISDYQAYLKLLEENGFKKHSDNGAEGMSGYVYTTSYTKEDLTLTVYYIAKYETTYIAASKKEVLSDHLVYSDAYMEGATADAKTKVHMMELNDNGNCFIIQLKNGHFIVEDGGTEADAPYLLDYLESLTPEGEKPVIEAWFMTHAHGDHYGALKKIMLTPDYVERIYVQGFYYVSLSKTVQDFFTSRESSVTQAIWYVTNAATIFEQEDGSKAKLYRPSLGQRYYFGDISIDIALTTDQFTPDTYYSYDFNDTSTWIMHNIEGQTFLHAGDASYTATKFAMDLYDSEYFTLDVFSVLHHGINVHDYFTDYCTMKTLLYTNRTVGSLYTATQYAREEENAHLQEVAAESLSHGNGTVVLTFPYKVGTAEIMKPCDWRYTNGERQYKIWDVVGGRSE